MWQLCNAVEHANDVHQESERLNSEIIVELERGSNNNEELSQLLNSIRPIEELESRTLASKKGWLRNVHALRERIKRRGLTGNTLRGMRNVMRQFLRPREQE